MNKKQFDFDPERNPVPWKGRYARIPGREPAFHVDSGGTITVKWFDAELSERLEAELVPSRAAAALGNAINEVKTEHGGAAGGSFLIDEFGDVICPVCGSSLRFLVGRITGVPEFRDPLNPGDTFNLKPDRTLPPGSAWKRPYIGMKFNLNADDRIYFKHDDEDGGTKVYPKTQDEDLASRIRKVRPSFQTVRFIVNLHGAVFTKVEPDWHAVFVGYINSDRWFPPIGI